MIKLLSESSWRVRASSIDPFVIFAKLFGEKDFARFLAPFCEKWLEDVAYAVRENAVKCIRDIIKEIGYGWAKETVIKKMLAFRQHHNYLFRVVPLLGFELFAELVSEDEISETYLPAVFELTRDKVANIRICAAKCLVGIAKRVENRAITEILTMMEKDPDADVRKAAKIEFE